MANLVVMFGCYYGYPRSFDFINNKAVIIGVEVNDTQYTDRKLSISAESLGSLGWARFAHFRRKQLKEPELEEVLALWPEIRVFLHQGLNKLFGLRRNVDRVFEPMLVHLHRPTNTFRIFSITWLRWSPSKGTLPVSSSYVSTPMHQMSTELS